MSEENKENEGSALAKLGKKPKPDAKTVKFHKDILQKHLEAMAVAEKALSDAQKAFEKASDEAIRTFGKVSLVMLGGILLEPSCRGERLYYKRKTQENAL